MMSEPYGISSNAELQLVFSRPAKREARLYMSRILKKELESGKHSTPTEALESCEKLYWSVFEPRLVDVVLHEVGECRCAGTNSAVARSLSSRAFIPARFVQSLENGGRNPAQLLTQDQVAGMRKTLGTR
uniref:Uncharacterized protein n=1 Tax=Trueperella pyogenes TaxID=1661 RepID=P94173_9ACTO|nr:hypothetical protein [Trueperella pyogenes]AAC46401.1 unknown [Trueperella pyogenes]